MSENFVKKQVYECSKCKRLFDSKEEFNEHYETMHNKMEKYEGAYIVSKDGKQIGRVLARFTNRSFMTILFSMSIQPFYSPFGEVQSISKFRYPMRIEDLEKKFDVVSKEVFKKQLEEKFIEVGYASLKSYPSMREILSDLTKKDEYRLKGDDDGN